MSLKKDFSMHDAPKQIIKNQHHIHFATQQSAIKRVNSLRKVESACPSFTPKINEMPFQIYPQRTKTQVSKQQIIQRLLDDRREKAESLRAEKVKKEESMYNEECTFHPKINLESRKLSAKEQERAKKTHQRLYEQGLMRMKSINEYTHLTSDEDKENCTFQPNIGKEKTKEKNGLAPIYDRIEQIICQKKQYLKRLQGQKYGQEIREKPEINYKSNAIVEKKQDFKKNVLERLFNHMKQKNNRLQKLADQRKDQLQKQCTFQPDINYQTEIQISGDFLERQQRQAEKMKEKLNLLKQRDQAAFQPSINKLSALLVQAERNGQTQEQKIQRLHYEPFLERKAQIQKIEEQIYKQCTFQPQINPLSKGVQIVPHSHKCACHPKEENYHFHPEINQKSRELAQKMKPKQEGLTVEQARLELQYKEMKQCTFRPKTLGYEYKSALQKKSVKEIPGANKYQVRIQKAKARKKQEQLFKQKLFSIEKRYVEHKQTKPQPFNLSSGQPKMPKLKQMAEEQFKKIHTFKPQTYARIR